MKILRRAPRGIQLDVDDLIQRALTRTGLSDFGDTWFLRPLNALVHFINAEAGLSSFDVQPVHRLIDMLCDRLRLAAYLKSNPEVLREPVHVAGNIFMQPRGGSTLSQRLIARSPQLTSTYFWELFTPIPLPGEIPGDPSERQKIGDRVVASWLKNMPEYVGMHPLNSRYHESDIWLLDRGFLCSQYNFHFNIPGYYDWMLEQDHSKSYEELQIWLKVLQFQSPDRKGKKWILRSTDAPISCNLPLFFKMFPNAKAIYTHRKMDQVIPSLCSVKSVHMRTSGSTTFHDRESGPRFVRQNLKAIDHMIKVRHEMPPGTFIDVQYKDLMSDPIGQFRRVLEGMGLTAGAEDIREATDWMSKNGRDTHPRHEYQLEDYGLTRQELEDAFKSYHDAFLS
jgi:hypothetical protein